MATSRIQGLTREQIYQIVGNNPRAAKVLENLFAEVINGLPDSVDSVNAEAEFLSLAPTVAAMSEAVADLQSALDNQAIRCAQLEAQMAELTSLVDGLMQGVEV